eukprot:gene26583-33184_t
MVTVAVNITYVYLNIHYNAVIVGVAQLLVAGYKLVWNDFVVRNLVIYARRFHTVKPLTESIIDEHYTPSISSFETIDMSFQTYTILFNILVTPCLATAALSSDCFYGVLYPPDPVQSSYQYTVCQSIAPNVKSLTGQCVNTAVETADTSYLPPFIYRAITRFETDSWQYRVIDVFLPVLMKPKYISPSTLNDKSNKNGDGLVSVDSRNDSKLYSVDTAQSIDTTAAVVTNNNIKQQHEQHLNSTTNKIISTSNTSSDTTTSRGSESSVSSSDTDFNTSTSRPASKTRKSTIELSARKSTTGVVSNPMITSKQGGDEEEEEELDF